MKHLHSFLQDFIVFWAFSFDFFGQIVCRMSLLDCAGSGYITVKKCFPALDVSNGKKIALLLPGDLHGNVAPSNKHYKLRGKLLEITPGDDSNCVAPKIVPLLTSAHIFFKSIQCTQCCFSWTGAASRCCCGHLPWLEQHYLYADINSHNFAQ